MVIILSDQSFPPFLQLSNGKCLAVIRIENGSLIDLVTNFFEILGGTEIGVGSLVLLASANHLGSVGAAAYADERGLRVRLGGCIDVRHGLPLLMDGSDSPHLIRSLYEVGDWLGNLKNKGERFPLCSYKKMLEISTGTLTGTVTAAKQPEYETRLRLPVSLYEFESKIWASRFSDLPAKIHKLESKGEE